MDSYNVERLKNETVETIRAMFPSGKADKYNWLIASISGVHGSFVDLDDIEATLELPSGSDGKFDRLTVLIIRPRTVEIIYGNILVETVEDIDFLRGLIESTTRQIISSQAGNYSEPFFLDF